MVSRRKNVGKMEKNMGEVEMHIKNIDTVFEWIIWLCAFSRFTWLWSSPQFCTRNRESVQREKQEKGVQQKLERKGDVGEGTASGEKN